MTEKSNQSIEVMKTQQNNPLSQLLRDKTHHILPTATAIVSNVFQPLSSPGKDADSE